MRRWLIALLLVLWSSLGWTMPANNFTAATAYDLNPALSAYPYEIVVTEDVNNASAVLEWNSGFLYTVGQYVQDPLGSVYQCILNTPGVGAAYEPPNATYWAFVGGIGTYPLDYAVWFKYTARVGESVLGLQAYAASGAAYRPFVTIWTGPPSSPTQLLPGDLQAGHNQQMQVPVTGGTTYYIKVIADEFSTLPFADLKLHVSIGPQTLAPIGSLFIPDDNGGRLPAAVLSLVDGTFLQYRGTVNGEEGDVLTSGVFAIINDDEADPLAVVIYSPQVVETASASPFSGAGVNSIRGDGASTFYVSHNSGGVTTVKTVSAAGVIGPTTWVLPSLATTIAPSRDGTILYYSNGGLAGAIKRYDLINDVPLSDLVGAVATHVVDIDLFVLADGNILATYSDTGADDYFARLMDPTGATIRDFPFVPPDSRSDGPRVALGSDDPDSFIMWASGFDVDGNRISKIEIFQTADGSSVSFTRPVSEAGIGPAGAGNDPDVPLFGISKSCPIMVLREPLPPLLALTASPTTIDNSAPCCVEGTPGEPNAGPPCAEDEPVVKDAFYRRCTGGGTVPTADDMEASEDWSDEFPPKEPDSWMTIQPQADEGEWKIGPKPLSDAGRFVEGRLEEISTIERRSSDKDGHYPPARLRVVARDDDGKFRGRLAEETTRQFINREARYDRLSYAGRKAGLDPIPRLQGRIVNVQPALDRKAVIELQDIMGAQYGALDPEKTIGLPIGDEHPALPVETKGKTYPVILGEWSDAGKTNSQGEDVSRGVLPAYDCGASFREDVAEPVGPDPNGNVFGDAAPIINQAIVNIVGGGTITSPIFMKAAPLSGGVIGQFSTTLVLDPNGDGAGNPSLPHAARYLFDEPVVPGTEYLVLLFQNPAFDPITNPAGDTNVRYKIVTAVPPDYPLHPEDDSLWGGSADFTSLTDGAQWGVQTTSAPLNLGYTITGTPGTTTYRYNVSAITPFGESLPSETLIITDGPDELNGTDNIVLTWDPPAENADAVIDYRVRGRTNATPNQSLALTGGAETLTDAGTAVPTDFNTCNEGTAVASEDVWSWIVCALGTVDVHEIYGSDLAENDTPGRTQLSTMGGYIDGPYVRTVGGIEQTGFWARGPVLNQHRQGLVTFAWNGCGWTGENGLVIDQAFLMLQTVLNECAEKNNGEGYRSGPLGPVERFSDGTPKFWTSQFQAAQDQTAEWLGTDLGYIGAMAILEPTALSEFLRQFFVTFGGHGTTNHWGQWYPYVLNPTPAEGAGRIYRERLEIARLLDHRLAHDETENRVTYRYLYDPDAKDWRASPPAMSDAGSIAARGGERIGIAETDLKDCFFGNDAATMADRWARHLVIYGNPPRYVQWATNLKSLPDHNGAPARFSHRKEGLGVNGETGTPGQIMHTSESTQPYEVIQTAMLFRPAIAENQLVSDDGGLALTAEDGDLLLVDGA